MKWIKYQLNTPVNLGTDDEPVFVDNLTEKALTYSEANLAIAEKEAYKGKYNIEDDGEPKTVVAPRNLTKGEYITVSGVMYKTTSNIPNGEHIITGQNAIETTIEKQLAELSKGE